MPWDKDKIKKIVEGALFSSSQPMNMDRLSGLFFDEERPTKDEFKQALTSLQEDYADRGVVLKEVASGYRFQVKEEVGEWVSRMWEDKPVRYSRALLETLALVAYRQPITRGEIEEIRGVSVSSHIMKTLLEREWVRVVGHRDVPGRPAMFATTRIFLDYFNLKNLVELPPLSEIRDFDKINEELELEDVGSSDSDDKAGVTSESGEGVDSETVDNISPESSPESFSEDVQGEGQAAEVEAGETAEVNEDGLDVVVENTVPETVEEKLSASEGKPAVSSLADIVRQFEANKAQESETDALDDAVASDAQLEEDLMLAEIVERQLEKGGEVPVGDLPIDEGEE
ncbi:SMC-Scp complex subunit ScpB [Gammaproteobacteria bacterium 42_54_T18]|nr:SMC-Scp complex subunit ScpB [Gammaproteobacteria bacterium 42_54_T18]